MQPRHRDQTPTPLHNLDDDKVMRVLFAMLAIALCVMLLL
jgi:hypothetical protein